VRDSCAAAAAPRRPWARRAIRGQLGRTVVAEIIVVVAGRTVVVAGRTVVVAGRTVVVAGRTVVVAGRTVVVGQTVVAGRTVVVVGRAFVGGGGRSVCYQSGGCAARHVVDF
jgi:hypothetical protein